MNNTEISNELPPPLCASDGWLSPEGKLHVIEEYCHDEFAESRGVTQDTLYARGWVKLSACWWYGDTWRDEIRVTQRQFDFIYDWHEALGKAFNKDLFQVK